jgi:hypothetical protein
MTRRNRLRRVVRLCAYFTSNLAYYRAGHNRLTETSPEFWITVIGNLIDIAVIEWCKLLGDRNGKHFWANVVADPPSFEDMMLRHLGMTADELAAYVNEMRTYRAIFLAHLDDLNIMGIPVLDRARAAAEFYHRHVVEHEAGAGDFVGLPTELPDYYRRCFEEAQAI